MFGHIPCHIFYTGSVILCGLSFKFWSVRCYIHNFCTYPLHNCWSQRLVPSCINHSIPVFICIGNKGWHDIWIFNLLYIQAKSFSLVGKFLYSLVDGIGRPKGKNSRQTFGTHSDKIKIPNSEKVLVLCMS